MPKRTLGTSNDAQKLSDVDVWNQLTLADLDVYEEGPRLADFTQDTLIDEIKRRWGSDALDRVATVITVGKFSPDDELRWLHDEPASFLKIVTGETTPEQFFARW